METLRWSTPRDAMHDESRYSRVWKKVCYYDCKMSHRVQNLGRRKVNEARSDNAWHKRLVSVAAVHDPAWSSVGEVQMLQQGYWLRRR
jgi:hypothetical protein